MSITNVVLWGMVNTDVTACLINNKQLKLLNILERKKKNSITLISIFIQSR